jgi:hypothetical protein
MNQKTEALKLIESLPDDTTFEDMQYHLYVMEKIRKGVEAFDRGESVSHAEVKAKVEQWRRSLGPSQR